jgi:hypothetical protein
VLRPWKSPFLYFVLILDQCRFDHWGEVDILLDKFWGEPFKEADEIMKNQDLTVTIRTRPDTDRRYGQCFRYSGGQKVRDSFHDDHEGPCLL